MKLEGPDRSRLEALGEGWNCRQWAVVCRSSPSVPEALLRSCGVEGHVEGGLSCSSFEADRGKPAVESGLILFCHAQFNSALRCRQVALRLVSQPDDLLMLRVRGEGGGGAWQGCATCRELHLHLEPWTIRKLERSSNFIQDPCTCPGDHPHRRGQLFQVQLEGLRPAMVVPELSTGSKEHREFLHSSEPG